MDIIYTILSLAVTGCAMLLALTAAGGFLRRRLPQWAVCLLFVAVVVRLLVPWSPSFSLMQRVYDGAAAKSAVADIADVAIPVAIPVPDADDTGEGAAKGAAQAQTEIAPFAEAATVVEPEPAAGKPFDWTALLFAVWLAGATVALVRTGVGYARLYRSATKGARPLELRELRDEAGVAGVAGIAGCPPVMVTDAVCSPMLIGLFKPVILLPAGDIPAERLRYILLHETAHKRRFDLGVKWLTELALTIHWFLPLRSLLRRQIGEACERACDERVVRDMDESGRREYIHTLLDAAADSGRFCRFATAMSGEGIRLRDRLQSAMGYKRTGRFALCVSMAAITAFAACGALLGGCVGGVSGNGSVSGSGSAVVSDGDAEEVFAAMWLYNVEINGDEDFIHREVLDVETVRKISAMLTPDESWTKYEKKGVSTSAEPIFGVVLDTDQLGPIDIIMCGERSMTCSVGHTGGIVKITETPKNLLESFYDYTSCYKMPDDKYAELLDALRIVNAQADETPGRTAKQILELYLREPNTALSCMTDEMTVMYQLWPMDADGMTERIREIIGDPGEWTPITGDDYHEAMQTPHGRGVSLMVHMPLGNMVFNSAGGRDYAAWGFNYYIIGDGVCAALRELTISNAAITTNIKEG